MSWQLNSEPSSKYNLLIHTGLQNYYPEKGMMMMIMMWKEDDDEEDDDDDDDDDVKVLKGTGSKDHSLRRLLFRQGVPLGILRLFTKGKKGILLSE